MFRLTDYQTRPIENVVLDIHCVTKEEEKQQEAMPTQPTESTDATPKPPSDTAATSETPEKTDEAIEPPKADATTATEGAPVPAEGETHDVKQEQEIIMIDEDD